MSLCFTVGCIFLEEMICASQFNVAKSELLLQGVLCFVAMCNQKKRGHYFANMNDSISYLDVVCQYLLFHCVYIL